MKREIHSRQQNQNVAYIIICIPRKNAHTFPRVRAFSLAGYRRERNVRSFPAASRGSRREGRVVDRFSSSFRESAIFFTRLSLSFSSTNYSPSSERKKEIVVLEQRRRLNATVASRGSLAIRARRIYTTAPNE